MPDFTVRGNPGAIRSRATLTAEKGTLFDDTGEALSKIDTSGWTGRAADKFRDAHDLEPDRWFKAGNGFRRAGAALLAYADAVERAQATATWAEQEYARGDRATDEYRGWFDSETNRLQNGLANGTYSSITLPTWDDPGDAIRQNAISELGKARAELDNAAHVCAGEVRAGCADAPEEPHWWESGLKFVGGIFQGAGEAIWDIATMLPFSPANLIQDAWKLTTGDLTLEELRNTYELDVETVQGMWNALQDDPVEFGKNLGKGLLDWDTWADDPARALGHLVPDAVVAVATAGTGTVATRGAGSIDDLVDGMRAIDRMEDAGALTRLDDLGDIRHVDLEDIPDWAGGRALDADTPGGDLYPGDYDRFGGLGEQSFMDRYWDPAGGRDGGGGWRWPEADGFVGVREANTLTPGDVIDRYSDFDGNYASPAGTPFEQRALPPSSVGSGYTQYEVVKPLPDSVVQGDVAPWFEQPGGGTQYMFDHPLEWYVENGYLRKVT